MANLTSRFLSLAALVNRFSELGGVKGHLMSAGREVLLALQELLDFVQEHVSSPDAASPNSIQGVITYARKTINQIVEQLPYQNEKEYQLLKRKVMHSLLDVIEGEIRRGHRLKDPKAKMRVQVFEAIRNVFLKEVYEQESAPS